MNFLLVYTVHMDPITRILQTCPPTGDDGIQEVGGLFLLISSKIWGNYCVWSFLTFAVVKNALIKIIHERVLVL